MNRLLKRRMIIEFRVNSFISTSDAYGSMEVENEKGHGVMQTTVANY